MCHVIFGALWESCTGVCDLSCRCLLLWCVFGSGQPQAELHPAAAAHPDGPAPDQTQALRTLGSREEHAAGVSEVRHPAQLLQEEEDAHDQRGPAPQLARQLQTSR